MGCELEMVRQGLGESKLKSQMQIRQERVGEKCFAMNRQREATHFASLSDVQPRTVTASRCSRSCKPSFRHSSYRSIRINSAHHSC